MNSNLVHSFVIAIGLLATSATAQAGTIMAYQFSGQLTDIRDSGAGFSFGDAFVATYVHDDAYQGGVNIEAGRIGYRGGQLSAWPASEEYIGPMVSELQVFDDYTSLHSGYDDDDGFFVSTFIYDATGFILIQFDLWDFSSQTLNSLAVPTHAELAQLAQYGRFWIRRFEGGRETGLARGLFSDFGRADPVSEAATLGILVIGLTGMASVIGRRRRSSLR